MIAFNKSNAKLGLDENGTRIELDIVQSNQIFFL
jgi:hypothetical protein